MRKIVQRFILFILGFLIGYHLVYRYILDFTFYLVAKLNYTSFFATEMYTIFRDKFMFSVAFALCCTILLSISLKFKFKLLITLLPLTCFCLRFTYLLALHNSENQHTIKSFWIGPIMLCSFLLLLIFGIARRQSAITNTPSF